jgi:hypothetical protein
MKRVFNQVKSISQKPKLEPPSLTLQTKELSTLGMHIFILFVYELSMVCINLLEFSNDDGI